MHFSRSPFIALAVSAMIGRLRNCGNAANRAGRLIAVHIRHHDVHQHQIDIRILFAASRCRPSRFRRGAPLACAVPVRWSTRKYCGRRHRRSAPCRRSRGRPCCRASSMICFCSSVRSSSRRFRKTAVSSSSRSLVLHPLHNRRVRRPAEVRISSSRSRPPSA